MDVDCVSSQHADQHTTQFQRESSIIHLCSASCHVVHQFGNVFKCHRSGLVHVCDANCTSRVYRDPYSSICLLSRKVHAPLTEPANIGARKRGACCSQDGADLAKRMNSSGLAGCQGYAQPMEA